MNVALYARVSTSDQTAETQLTALRRYCEAHGWTILEEYVDTIGGAVADRPALARLMVPANLRRFGAVLVWKFDRMFRSVPHMVEVLDRFRTVGIDFVSATECIDTSTPAGRMVYHMLAAVGQFERDLICERTRAGMARAKAEGRHIGRPRVTVDLAECARMRAEGRSYRQIAASVGHISAAKIHALLREPVLKLTDTVCERRSHGTL